MSQEPCCLKNHIIATATVGWQLFFADLVLVTDMCLATHDEGSLQSVVADLLDPCGIKGLQELLFCK